jgi:hypothetical protein
LSLNEYRVKTTRTANFFCRSNGIRSFYIAILLTKAGGRRQEAGGCFCNGDLGSPLQKFFAFKGEVLDLIFSIMVRYEISGFREQGTGNGQQRV